MKKALVILVVLVMASPLCASTITFTDDGGGVISWTSDVAVVAMALNVDVTAGDPISGVAVDSFFDIYMDSAYDDPCNYGYGNGTPIAHQDIAGEIALPQSNFCISMGGLGGESEPLNDPCTSGTITLSAGAVSSFTINENALRGGVIDENGDTMTTNLPITFDTCICDNCFERYYAVGTPEYILWSTGTDGIVVFPPEPDCWCYDAHQCGDVNGDCAFTIALDIMPMVTARAGHPATYDPCADANYDGAVTIALDIMAAVNHRAGIAPHVAGPMGCLDGTCPNGVTGGEQDLSCDPVATEPVEALWDGCDDGC